MNRRATHFFDELDIFCIDLNGQLRGKRMPLTELDKVRQHGFAMPRSILAADYWGDNVEGHDLNCESGDYDGQCLPVSDAAPMPWLEGNNQQMIAMMFDGTDNPFMADPRQILAVVLQRYKALGLTPVVATELEFYLLDEHNHPLTSTPSQFDHPHMYAMTDLDNERTLLAEIRHACQVQHIPMDTCISEFGDGQFECNLLHVPDALLAADHAILFKRLTQAIAKKHGKSATFMPKPFMNKSGSGLHLHVSLLDQNGNNVFDNGTDHGSDMLGYAVAGIIRAMPDSMLIFSPNLNSYRRLLAGSLAPIIANWGYRNRTTAVRIPESPNAARRLEHRVSGADANPYLVIAAVLAAALDGIQNKLNPPPAINGNGYEDHKAQALPVQWHDAIRAFEQSTLLPMLLGAQFSKTFHAIKKQEFNKFSRYISPIEYQLYL